MTDCGNQTMGVLRSLRSMLVMSNRVRREVPRLAFNQTEAAEALGISVDHFERHIKSQLAVVYSGSLRLYPRRELERWLETHTISRTRRVA